MKVRRISDSEAEVMPLIRFLLSQTAVCTAEIYLDRAVENVWLTVQHGRIYVAEDDDGNLIGSLGINSVPKTWYCAEDNRCFLDEWFLVDPSNAGAGPMLLKAATDESDIPVFVRRLRPGASKPGVEADIIVGRVTRIS